MSDFMIGLTLMVGSVVAIGALLAWQFRLNERQYVFQTEVVRVPKLTALPLLTFYIGALMSEPAALAVNPSFTGYAIITVVGGSFWVAMSSFVWHVIFWLYDRLRMDEGRTP